MARSLLLPEVISKTALQKTAIYARIKTGDFPAPAKLGAHRSVWLESEVDAWILAQFDRARGVAAPPASKDGTPAHAFTERCQRKNEDAVASVAEGRV